MKTFSIIVAVAENNVIGDSKTNSMPWKMKSDLQSFKEITTGGIVIMGKNTALSLPNKKPLKDRDNIVVTRTLKPSDNLDFDFFITKSFDEALHCAEHKLLADEFREIFVIGGSRMYQAALRHPALNKIYMTKIHAMPSGDVLFPDIDMTKWHITSKKECKADDLNQYDADFLVLERSQEDSQPQMNQI